MADQATPPADDSAAAPDSEAQKPKAAPEGEQSEAASSEAEAQAQGSAKRPVSGISAGKNSCPQSRQQNSQIQPEVFKNELVPDRTPQAEEMLQRMLQLCDNCGGSVKCYRARDYGVDKQNQHPTFGVE